MADLVSVLQSVRAAHRRNVRNGARPRTRSHSPLRLVTRSQERDEIRKEIRAIKKSLRTILVRAHRDAALTHLEMLERSLK